MSEITEYIKGMEWWGRSPGATVKKRLAGRMTRSISRETSGGAYECSFGVLVEKRLAGRMTERKGRETAGGAYDREKT